MKLDQEALYVALDKKRRQSKLSWRGLGKRIGVSSSLFTRLAYGKGNPTADNLITLILWLDIPIEEITKKEMS